MQRRFNLYLYLHSKSKCHQLPRTLPTILKVACGFEFSTCFKKPRKDRSQGRVLVGKLSQRDHYSHSWYLNLVVLTPVYSLLRLSASQLL